ncbi:MAG: DUF932 domain-containing protein [Planctomycetota bacterium]|nr:MAG: DUF932 domain-containing protein [Planctomycetota bacterium]REJ90336.1 MAG: DUF932 domain-containing protein [Planctomycetota bacterium]
MVNLTQASRELFSRPEDERFDSLESLLAHAEHRQSLSTEHWQPWLDIEPTSLDGHLGLRTKESEVLLNDWSFTQLCKLSGVHKDTLNRLSVETAATALREVRPSDGSKPLQLYSVDNVAAAIHGASYTRLHDADLLRVVQETAVDFTPPPEGFNGATGLYAGEQDMFAFLIDPNGWVEIGEETFAPGFFVWNSEVGRRTVGISTFWFQAICQNHIVWDTTEVVEFTRKHTAKVHEALDEIRYLIESLVRKRDERKDGFSRVIENAMTASIGDREDAQKLLTSKGFSNALTGAALDLAAENGLFTVFSVVDALTRLSQKSQFAGNRTDADQRAAALLSLAV